MPILKNNHYMPRMLLKHWVTDDETKTREGVYVLDAEKEKTYFSTSKGKKAFSFAIKKDLYVPRIADKRILDLEKWFGSLENSLSKTITKIIADSHKPLFSNNIDLSKFVLAIFSIKHRSRFQIEKNRELLTNNPDILELVKCRPDNNLELILLENLMNSIEQDSRSLPNFEMVVMESIDTDLIFGDLPFLDNIADGFSFVPITCKHFIAIRNTTKESFYTKETCSRELTESINRSIASKSRYWIISNNRDQLLQYTKEFKQNQDVTARFKPAKFNMRGLIFKNS
ncbi:MAG: DUF4238 domain-containing protein [Saprospiraceae bacterium]